MSQSHLFDVAFRGQQSEPVEPLRPFSHSLPFQPTPLVGREREVEIACQLLRRAEVRLLTLTGPPGTGKTRLALEIGSRLAEDTADGTYFVPLAPITEPRLVLSAVAQSLGVREEPGQAISQNLANYLGHKRVLLVLDNFEQVIGAGIEVAELFSLCPYLKVLVTSRELLGIYGEYDYSVPPLSLPDRDKLSDPQELGQCEAVTLFVQRAQAASPSFALSERSAPAVAEICLHLDGLPLAIELAAARVLVLPPEELLARLKSSVSSRFSLLTGGARNLPERQRTLQAAIDWSYNLLDLGEQVLFRRLGVFVGGCTLQAIEEICGSGSEPENARATAEPAIDTLDGVASLVSKSLLQWHDGAAGERRFTMLETIRDYALEKLMEGGEFDSIAERRMDYFLRLAGTAEQGSAGNEQALWVRQLDAEQDNLRAALEWSVSREGEVRKGLRLASALMGYWDDKGYFSEGQRWYTQLLSRTEPRPEGTGPDAERATALRALARMTWQLGDSGQARSIYEQSVEMFRALGDDRGTAVAMLGLGSVAMWQGDYDISNSLFQECLDVGRRLSDRHVVSDALSMIGVILMRKQEYQAAQSWIDEALAIARASGNKSDMADALIKRGSLAVHLGEYEQAKALIEEGLGIARESGDERIMAFSLARLGMIGLRQGNPQHAEPFLLEGLARAQHSGLKRWSRWYLVGLAEIARLRGMALRGAKLIGVSEGVLSAGGAHYEPATHVEIDRIIASVQAELDDEIFARLRAEGKAMSYEEAMAYALGPASDAASEPAGADTLPSRLPGASPTNDGTPIERKQAYPDGLTEREVEVLRLIATGKSNQEIAHELVLSLRTVERHISNTYQKIGATGRAYARATATAYALKRGLTV